MPLLHHRVGVKGERLALPTTCPLEVVAITKCCWRNNPVNRPRPGDVVAILQELLNNNLSQQPSPTTSP